MPAPFRVSPSLLARYFFHDCERFLRFSAATAETRRGEGLPERGFDTSPLMRAILESGYEWEETVLERHLAGRVSIASGSGPLRERRFGSKETLDLLRTEPAGRWIYQGSLVTPAPFYARHGIDRAAVSFGESHPDLIEVRAGEAGERVLRVVDLKRGETLRPAYAVQVALYALELEAILEEAGIADARVDLARGGVWLGGQPAATEFDLEGALPHVRRFLREDVKRILAPGAKDPAWHFHFRCEWCEYQDHCGDEMRRRNDVSRLPHLTSYGKRHLARENVTTLPELETFLKRPDADERLSLCASLAGKRPELATQVAALLSDEVRLPGGTTPALPKGENICVVVTVQREPLGRSTYLAGLLVGASAERLRAVFGREPPARPEVHVASGPEDVASLPRWLVEKLHDALARVHRWNETHADWKEQLMLQVYVHSERERALLVECLLTALRDVDLAERAMSLLFHFQGPDLVKTDEHPANTVSYPVVVLLDVIGRVAALPVEVSTRLHEALEALESKYEYRRSDFWHYPLGHGLKPDAIHAAWYRGRSELVEAVRQEATRYLFAVRALLYALRARVEIELFAWPPKFFLPEASPFQDPLLSRLAFFAQYESVLDCLGARDARGQPREVQLLQGTAIQLVAETDRDFRVVGEPPAGLEESGLSKWLLVRDTPAGRRAQLAYQDYTYRSYRWKYAKADPDRALAAVSRVELDDVGFPRRVTLDLAVVPFAGAGPRAGERFLLYPRFTDWTTERTVSFLRDLDAGEGGVFVDLLRAPAIAARAALLPLAVEAVATGEEASLALTESQVDAYRRVRIRKITAVWGPPGTGKTWFLASAVVGLASAHAQAGLPFRVLVTAFTHAAIENVLRKIAERLAGGSGPRPALDLAKAGRIDGAPIPGVGICDDAGIASWARSRQLVGVGATVHACVKTLKRDRETPAFDLVIVDEASQVRVPESAVPTTLVAEGGRLVFAGDDRQLPPIVKGVYPDAPEGEPILHRSVFEAIRSRPNGEDLVMMLLENWRMNDVLTSYARELLYKGGYCCATTTVASARLAFRPAPGISPFASLCLEPALPLVVVVLEGVAAAKENRVEAELVADLVTALRDGLDVEDDAAFFQRGVFVVSPHHAQIREIRRRLGAQRRWDAEPFVDTVEKMQGQEADAVIVSYGVSDPELALREAEFIYGLNRLNVSITRGRTKTVLFLPRPLLDASPQVLESDEAAKGLGYMRRIVEEVERRGVRAELEVGEGARAVVLRPGTVIP